MAVVFIVVLFSIKNKSTFKNTGEQQEGLTYKNEILGDLVNRDTDQDGVLDWEEGLWGTNPTKGDTNDDGVSDNVEIAKIKEQQGRTTETTEDIAKLTQTDKFSRELFATVAVLNQNGQMDQAMIDKLSSSLAEHIQNSPPKKVYTLSNLKVIKSNTTQAIKTYNTALENLQKKYPAKRSVMDVLQEFSGSGDEPDISVLSELDPIIEQISNIINAVIKISVPQSLSALHLDFLNAMQKLLENINDIQLYETDTILALGAISQYDKNTQILQSVALKLSLAIEQKLK